jgi:hypothetical protein
MSHFLAGIQQSKALGRFDPNTRQFLEFFDETG